MATLRIDGLTKRFGGFTAVEDFGIDIGQGEFVSLLAPRAAARARSCA